jgi:FkbM family methyltransferase
MTELAKQLAEPSRAPIRAVEAGRRLTSTSLPKSLGIFRAGAKKLTWTALEARLVSNPLRYAFRELVHPTVADYSLRSGNGRISLRHRSGDIDIFRKFYAYRYYEWPTEVKAQLSKLARPVDVLDLGANIGFFDVHARNQMPIGSVVCFEPHPETAAVLERVRDANGATWRVIRACASNRDGTARFNSGRHNFSRIESDGDREVPMFDAFEHVAAADLVKMNIEGSEWEILQDARLADTSCVWIVEYHRLRNPEADITSLIRSLFESSGYTTRIAMNHEDNGLLWAWKC